MASEHPFSSYVTRQSIFLLLARVIFLEILLEAIGLLPRIILSIFFPSLLIYQYIHILLDSLFILLTITQLGLLLYLFFSWETTYYEIKLTEIDSWRGVLHKKKEIFSFVHAESVSVVQSFLGRIFHFGTVIVYVPTLKQEIHLVDIPHPHKVADFLKQELPEKDSSFFMRR